MTNRKSDHILIHNPKDEAPASRESAWEAMERFVRELQNLEQSNDQIRSALRGVKDSVGADVVYWYCGLASEPPEVVGTVRLAPDWCRELAQRLLMETPGVGSQLLRSGMPVVSTPPPQPLRSVAMVRISKTQSTWMVALSFTADRAFRLNDLKIMNLAKRMLLNQRQHGRVYSKLKETLFGLVRCLTTAIDAKDPYTYGHSERVGRIAMRLGKQMELSHVLVSDIYLAGLLHDIGKIGVRDSVLQKPGKLTPEDFAHVKEHVIIGDRIMANIKQLAHLRPGVRNHHERFDGQGYPDALAGENIPLIARILAVADSCDAMMSARPYRRAMPTVQIDEIIQAGAGTQWDPIVVQHFMQCRDELYSICQHGLGESVLMAVEHTVDAGNQESMRMRPSMVDLRIPGI